MAKTDVYQIPPTSSLSSYAITVHKPALYWVVDEITLTAARPEAPAPMMQIDFGVTLGATCVIAFKPRAPSSDSDTLSIYSHRV